MAEAASSVTAESKQGVVCSVDEVRNYYILQASTTPTRLDEDEPFNAVFEEVK
jgi:hypothetical protein